MQLPQIPVSKTQRAAINLTTKRLVSVPSRPSISATWAFSKNDYDEYQLAAFNRIYEFARCHVPYYQSSQMDYPELASLGNGSLCEKLKQLPVISKSTVKANNSSFWPRPQLHLTSFHTTSGTSGTPMKIAGTLAERALSFGVMEEWIRRLCGTRRPRTLKLSGFLTPPAMDKRLFWTDRLTGSVYLSIYSLSVSRRAEVEELFKSFRPQLIEGYASAVHQLALLFDGKPAPGHDSIVSIVTSEVLEPHWRSQIETNLSMRLRDFYGSQEGSHAVMECEQGNFHINPQIGVVEILDGDGRSASAGELGRVVVTSLIKKSMPLIRYEIGDVAMSTGFSRECACGIKWPTIGSVQGRSEDLVRTRDGRKIGYLCFHATKNLSGIKEAQLIQTSFEDFVFHIVVSEIEAFDRENVESSIRGEISNRVQSRTNVEFRYPEQIERGPNGKFKAVAVEF